MNWGTLESFIYATAENTLFAFAAVLAFNLMALEKDWSGRISLVILLAGDLISIKVTPVFYKMIETGKISDLAWYPFFSVLHTSAIAILLACHSMTRLEINRVAVCVMGLMASLTAMNVVMFFDLVFFDVLRPMYQFGVPALKILFVVLLFQSCLQVKGVRM